MPKPTRRERRRLSEQGKLPPRRERAPTSQTPSAPATLPRTRTRSNDVATATATAPRRTEARAAEPPVLPDRQEYAYVKSDLMRIMLLAGTLIAAMVALRFVIPQ